MSWNNVDKGHLTNTVKFNIPHLLESIVGYKGMPFPAAWLGRVNGRVGQTTGGKFKTPEGPESTQAYADNGAVLRKFDLLGNYYFMPVVFSANGRDYEIDCALVSLQLKKTIVETPLVGQRGSVKELISRQDYHVSITGCLISGEKGFWPEDRVNALRELYEINDAVSLKCALTDCFFDEDDKVVITEMSFPNPDQVEDVVPVSLQCVSDRVFELKID